MDSFAQRLTLLRESKDLKKKELAQILNVSAACISQYESGNSMPGHDILTKMAQYFGVSIDFLLANEHENINIDLSQLFYSNTSYWELIRACDQVPIKKRATLLEIVNALQDTEDN